MPKFREVSVDEYLGKRSMVSRDGMVYRAAKMPKSFSPEERSAVFVMTDESVDSYGDIVKAAGADLYRFEKNPIALLNHRSDMILGTWSDVQKKPQRLEGKVTLASEGSAPHIDMAFNLMSQGILKGASIGFMPTKLEMRLDDDGDPTWCYIIHEWELYECSVVSIPANPSALARSAGNSGELSIARDYIEQVLDSWVKSPEGLILPRSEFEAAYRSVVEKIADDVVAPGGSGAATPEVKADEPEAEESKTTTEGEDDPECEQMEEAEKAFTSFVAELGAGDTLTLEAGFVEVEPKNGFRCFGKSETGGIFTMKKADGSTMTLSLAAIPAKHVEIADNRIAALKAAAEAENKTETIAPVVVALSADTTEVEAAAARVEGIFTRLAKMFPMFFPKAFEERIEPTIVPDEPPEPPSGEAIAAAQARAAAVRERLATKGLIAA